MLTIAIVGRPNVGKSTLFNRLSHTKKALVASVSGLTRDRQYSIIYLNSTAVNLIDTGGITNSDTIIDNNIKKQVLMAIKDVNIIYFLVTPEGVNTLDREIVDIIRPFSAKVVLVVNKCDNKQILFNEFFALGFNNIYPISAEHGIGIDKLLDKTIKLLPFNQNNEDKETILDKKDSITIAVLGRPNVGKSTLINKILGYDRVITSAIAGTTRDSIDIDFTKDDVNYTLIDTAGIRRKRSVSDKIEKFSIIKAKESVVRSAVVLLILDATEAVTEQDATLLGMTKQSYSALIILINKIDNLESYQKQQVERQLAVKLSFINYAKVFYISALHGTGVGLLFNHINQAYAHANTKFSTATVNKILAKANKAHNAPVVQGKRSKLKYAYQSATLPPTFTLFGSHLQKIPDSYIRFLHNIFIKELKLVSTPIKLIFKNKENPFKGNKNKLNIRQIKKRKRLMKFVKGKK